MTPIDEIKQNLSKFTKKELLIADYVLKNPIETFQLTADEVVKKTKSSKPAFIRMCQKLGYSGYADFRFAMSRALVSQVDVKDKKSNLERITEKYASFITDIPMMISEEQVKNLAQKIATSNKVKLFGYNRTGLSAQQLRFRMSKIGYDAEAVTDTVLIRDVSAKLAKNDLFIMFSCKASSTLYEYFAEQIKSSQCHSVLITMNPEGSLPAYFNEVIQLPFISRSDLSTFYDDQAIFFVFIEILLSELARL